MFVIELTAIVEIESRHLDEVKAMPPPPPQRWLLAAVAATVACCAAGGRDSKVNWWLEDRTDSQGSEFVAQHSQAATGIIPCWNTWEIYDDGTSWPDMSTFTGKW